MRLYVYGCTQSKDHPRVEVLHEMGANPFVSCSVCKKPMERVPQMFSWSHHPTHALFELFDRRFSEWKTKELKKRKRQA